MTGYILHCGFIIKCLNALYNHVFGFLFNLDSTKFDIYLFNTESTELDRESETIKKM